MATDAGIGRGPVGRLSFYVTREPHIQIVPAQLFPNHVLVYILTAREEVPKFSTDSATLLCFVLSNTFYFKDILNSQQK